MRHVSSQSKYMTLFYQETIHLTWHFLSVSFRLCKHEATIPHYTVLLFMSTKNSTENEQLYL